MPVETPPPKSSPRIVSVQEIEAVLRRLRGVVAARVVRGAAGGIDEVHAVAEAGRPAKMLVRDIESALLAHWNLAPGRNKISVAQLQPGQTAEALKGTKPRLRLVSAEVSEQDGAWTARVVLRQGNTPADYVGMAAAPTGSDRARLLAAAALRAVEGGGGSEREGRLRLLDISPLSLAERPALVLLVALRTDKGDDLLTGSALLRSDPDRAVVAATLDAVNRRLASLEAPAGGL